MAKTVVSFRDFKRKERKAYSLVQLFQEKFNRSSAYIHHLQDDYYVVSGHNLQSRKEFRLRLSTNCYHT